MTLSVVMLSTIKLSVIKLHNIEGHYVLLSTKMSSVVMLEVQSNNAECLLF